MSLITDLNNKKNLRLSTAWELFRKIYRPKLSLRAFIFGDYLYEVISELINEESDFDGDYFKFVCRRQDIYDYLKINESTFRKKDEKTGLSPRIELERIGFVFKDGKNKNKARKGYVLVPLFADLVINSDDIILDTFSINRFGKEKTIQRLKLLAEKARNLGRLIPPDEIDYAKANINNFKMLNTDNEEMKKQKLRKQYLCLLHKKGLDHKTDKQFHYASVNQILNVTVTNQFYYQLEKAIGYIYKNNKPLGLTELNDWLRTLTIKLINKILEPKITMQEKIEIAVDKKNRQHQVNVMEKLKDLNTKEEKIAYLEKEKEYAFTLSVDTLIGDDYYHFVIDRLNELKGRSFIEKTEIAPTDQFETAFESVPQEHFETAYDEWQNEYELGIT